MAILFMVTAYKAPIDLGKLIVRNIIGEVFGNNLIRVTVDLFNYREIMNSIATEKTEGEVPALSYTTEYDGAIKQRVFNIHGFEVIVVYDLKTFKPMFFMDATVAGTICEHWVNTEKVQNPRGFTGLAFTG